MYTDQKQSTREYTRRLRLAWRQSQLTSTHLSTPRLRSSRDWPVDDRLYCHLLRQKYAFCCRSSKAPTLSCSSRMQARSPWPIKNFVQPVFRWPSSSLGAGTWTELFWLARHLCTAPGSSSLFRTLVCCVPPTGFLITIQTSQESVILQVQENTTCRIFYY